MSLIDDIQQGFVNAVDDIRHSVVEQGWFGQETSDNISTGNTEIATPEITAPEIEPPPSQESIMEMFTPPPQEPEPEMEQEQGVEI